MAVAFDEQRQWTLDSRVVLRPESFGALAYHYGTRRLSLLKHPTLVRVVEALDEHPSAAEACAAIGVQAAEHAAVASALGTLADTGMIVEREEP